MNAETAALAEFVRAIVRICDTHDRYRPQPPTWNDDGSVNPNDVETFIRELSPSVDELHHAALRECTRNNTVSVLCPEAGRHVAGRSSECKRRSILPKWILLTCGADGRRVATVDDGRQ